MMCLLHCEATRSCNSCVREDRAVVVDGRVSSYDKVMAKDKNIFYTNFIIYYGNNFFKDCSG